MSYKYVGFPPFAGVIACKLVAMRGPLQVNKAVHRTGRTRRVREGMKAGRGENRVMYSIVIISALVDKHNLRLLALKIIVMVSFS